MKNICAETETARGGSGDRSVELKLCSSVAVIPLCHESCDQPQSCEKQGLSRSFLAIVSSWDRCSFRIVQPRNSLVCSHCFFFFFFLMRVGASGLWWFMPFLRTHLQ